MLSDTDKIASAHVVDIHQKCTARDKTMSKTLVRFVFLELQLTSNLTEFELITVIHVKAKCQALSLLDPRM